MWIAAGPVYPILIGALEIRDYVLFIISLAISGIAVAAYPFMIVTWLCTHVFYRPFVCPGSISDGDFALLKQVDSWKWTYLSLAGGAAYAGYFLGVYSRASSFVTTGGQYYVEYYRSGGSCRFFLWC